jgi:hypothetical protein
MCTIQIEINGKTDPSQACDIMEYHKLRQNKDVDGITSVAQLQISPKRVAKSRKS